ncbi:hypothetical protein [Brucella anthropi]|uniref:hypothetical protein n=1 Tax=Brucella anthropi TaxID=529 RepID=UPI003D962148
MSDLQKLRKEAAERSLQTGSKYPYDATDRQRESGKMPKAKNWAHAAARGVVADLTDRRAIKRGFEGIDEDVRYEIVRSIATIIEVAASHIETSPECSRLDQIELEIAEIKAHLVL